MSKKLGEILLEDGRVTDAQLQKALKAQLIFGGHLGTSLIELGYVDEDTLGETLSKTFNVPYATFDILQNVPYSVIRAVPAKLVEKYKVIPIRLDGKTLQLAMMDPKNLMAHDEISFVTGYKIDPWVAPEIRIFQVLEKYYNVPRSQRYITLARELSKLRSRHERIQPSSEAPRSKAPSAEAEDDGSPDTAPMRPEPPRPEPPRAEAPRAATAPSGEPPPRPAVDHWEKYGYGRSWREYAEEMERRATQAPPAGAAIAEAPAARGREAPRGSPEEELAAAAKRLAVCTTPEEVASVVMAFATRFLRRCAFFVMRGDRAVGFDGAGEGIVTERVKGLNIEPSRDSLLSLIEDGRRHFLGNVPAFPSIRQFYQDVGIPMPRVAFLLPIQIKEKTASILYGDGGGEDDLHALDVQAFERLAVKASLALQMIILKGKIASG